MKKICLITFISFIIFAPLRLRAQTVGESSLVSPPMGWMSWNYFGENISEKGLREMADAMVSSGMKKAGYQYLFIGDGWQGGRDKRNNIIADTAKFPSGMKALADYVHSKGLKLGIYSVAGQLTCAGYTGSLHFEEQDSRTFAEWGIDYIKYDYCGSPADSLLAMQRYKKMEEALLKSGRLIRIGYTKPWLYAKQKDIAFGSSINSQPPENIVQNFPNQGGPTLSSGTVIELVDINSKDETSEPGTWPDPEVLAVGLHSSDSAMGDSRISGFSEIEYQSQLSLWSIMGFPMVVATDIRNLNALHKRFLLNDEIIAINQDISGKKAVRLINDDNWSVFLKPLSNGDYAVAILNRTASLMNYSINWSKLGLNDQFVIRDVWQQQFVGKGRRWRGRILGHETRVFRLKKV